MVHLSCCLRSRLVLLLLLLGRMVVVMEVQLPRQCGRQMRVAEVGCSGGRQSTEGPASLRTRHAARRLAKRRRPGDLRLAGLLRYRSGSRGQCPGWNVVRWHDLRGTD